MPELAKEAPPPQTYKILLPPGLTYVVTSQYYIS